MTVPSLQGILAVSRLRLLLLASLIITWWFAFILPTYKPAFPSLVSTRFQRAKDKMPSFVINWHPRHGPRSQYNQSKLALLIEPRPIPHLVTLILHMISVVPPDWPFLVIGSPESIAMIDRAYSMRYHQENGKLELALLPAPWKVQSKEDVFRLLTDLRFYDEVLPDAEWIFRYEADSILCANSDRGLDEWLGWNWVSLGGAQNDRFAGSGGLSIRRASAVRQILGFQQRYNDTEPEDAWFMKRFKAMPGDETSTTPMTGGMITNQPLMINPMGYHIPAEGPSPNDKTWKDLGSRKRILEYCPELSIIMDMKLERERCPDDDRHGGRGPTPGSTPPEAIVHIKRGEAQPVRINDMIHLPRRRGGGPYVPANPIVSFPLPVEPERVAIKDS